jgi:hypothetical protein
LIYAPAVSPTAARLIALPFALSAFAARMLETFWITPLTWRIESGLLAFAAWMVTLLVSVGLPLAGYLLVTRRARRREATWQIEPGGPGGAEAARFVAPAAPRWTGSWAILVGWMAGAGLMTERVPGEDRMRIADFGYALPVSIVLVSIAWLAIVAIVAMGRPRLMLDWDGATLRRPLGRLRLAWQELIPGGPPLPAKRNPESLAVYRLAAGVTAPVLLPAGRLQVDSAFLAHTIRYYTEHPEQRGSIGTQAGLDALRSAFAGGGQGGPAQSSTS